MSTDMQWSDIKTKGGRMVRNLIIATLLLTSILAITSCEKIGIGESGSMASESNDPALGLAKEMQVVFTGKEDHLISLSNATQMTDVYRLKNPDGPWGWYFGGEAIQSVLAQNGAVGLRIYGGLNQEGQFSPVVFGVTADGKDITGSGLHKALLDSGVVILEMAPPCPPECPGNGQ